MADLQPRQDSQRREADSAPSAERRMTASDIARIVGTSSATVSYALNGNPGVSDALRARILEIAREHGFRPNLLAQGLRRGRSDVIGLLLADIANPFYPEIASRVISAAAESGHQVFLSHAGIDGALLATAARALVDHRCEGLIFTSVGESDRPVLAELRAEGVPFVFINRYIDGLDADFVGIDDEAAGRTMLEHVLSCGYTRIALLGGEHVSSASRNRMSGFVSALGVAGLSPVNQEGLYGPLTHESGFERAEVLLEGGSQPPQAIVCGNDMIALGVMDAVLARGLSIPGDVAVTGYDDMSFASVQALALTTLRVPREAMGAAAVRLLLERSSGYAGPARQDLQRFELVIRRTCGSQSNPGSR